MELKLVKRTAGEILKILEAYQEENEYDECEMSNLDEFIGSDNYCCDKDNVYIKAKDGLLVIPYDYTNDNEYFIVYQVLSISHAYLAHQNKKKIEKVIKQQEDLLNELKMYNSIPEVENDGIIGEILIDGTIERGQTEDGFMYWNPNAFKSKEGVCYVSELDDMKFTYNDFLEISKGNHEIAERIFNILTWQSPYIVFEEWEGEDEVHVCKNCEKAYFSYEVNECPFCGEQKVID